MKLPYKLLIVVLLLVILFFPKKSGFGYGGKVTGVDQTLYREEKTCLGYKYSTISGNPWGFGRCIDCGKTFYCLGLPLNKSCYTWKVNGSYDFSNESRTLCR